MNILRKGGCPAESKLTENLKLLTVIDGYWWVSIFFMVPYRFENFWFMLMFFYGVLWLLMVLNGSCYFSIVVDCSVCILKFFLNVFCMIIYIILNGFRWLLLFLLFLTDPHKFNYSWRFLMFLYGIYGCGQFLMDSAGSLLFLMILVPSGYCWFLIFLKEF